MTINHNLTHIALGAPIPGQSLTDTPGNAPWEKPPQFVKLEDAMNFMMDSLTEPHHMKELLNIMQGGMPIEAITRTLLFTGFSTGKWTVDLGLLMYKPLMMSLIAIAHRAGIKDIPIIMPKALTQYKLSKLKSHMLTARNEKIQEQTGGAPVVGNGGFMRRFSGAS